MGALFYLGIDVSKNTLAVILLDQKEKIIWSNSSILNTLGGFQKLLDQATKRAAQKSGGEDYVIAAGMVLLPQLNAQKSPMLHVHE